MPGGTRSKRPVVQMNETGGTMAGAGSRILAEVIKTPAFVELIKTNAFELEPEAAASLVHTLLWQDSAFGLAMAAASPRYVNYLAVAAIELGRSMSAFPAPLLLDFVTQLIDGIDTSKIAEMPEAYGPVFEGLLASEELRRRIADGIHSSVNSLFKASVSVMSQLETSPGTEGLDAKAMGQALTLAARAFNRRVAKDPYVLRDVIRNADGAELLKAAMSAAKAIGVCIMSSAAWLFSAVRGMAKKTTGGAQATPTDTGGS
jgi:hypothetical protein